MERLKLYIVLPWGPVQRTPSVTRSHIDCRTRANWNGDFVDFALRMPSSPRREPRRGRSRLEHRVVTVERGVGRRELESDMRAAGLLAGERAGRDEPGERMGVAQERLQAPGVALEAGVPPDR